MDVKVLFNYDDELYCCDCKKRIELGQKFAMISEEDYLGSIQKVYCLECIPETEIEPYIGSKE
jgi:hypothetical protein